MKEVICFEGLHSCKNFHLFYGIGLGYSCFFMVEGLQHQGVTLLLLGNTNILGQSMTLRCPLLSGQYRF